MAIDCTMTGGWGAPPTQLVLPEASVRQTTWLASTFFRTSRPSTILPKVT